VLTLVIALALKFTIGLRLSDEDEVAGIDESEHAESAYDFSTLRTSGGGLGTPRPDAATPAAAERVAAASGKEG
jgi:Amt family ammonium transporter